MARIAARNARLYVAITQSNTSPEPIAFLNKLAMSQTVDKFDVTSFGDSNKTYVSGLPDASGTFAGFYDTVSPGLYTASLDGVARNFYLYPDITAISTAGFFKGQALFDFSVDLDVGGAAAISGSWSAASAVTKSTNSTN